MVRKPNIIYLLVILWIIIGVIFIGIAISSTQETLDFIDSFGNYEDEFSTLVVYSLVSSLILYIICIILSFLLAYGTFIKKELFWLIGLMFSSFLLYFVFSAINLIGGGIIRGSIGRMFDTDFHNFALIFFIFLAPCQIFFLTRPEVKSYFGKGIVQTKDREIYTFNKMTTKTIKCPDCGKIQEVQGILGERVEVTCKKCNSKGFVNFR
jgi:hypothetical protein